MPFVNKELQFSEFMEGLHRRIHKGSNTDALIFFECFLQKRLPEELARKATTPDWDGRVDAGDFDVVYPMAAEILRDAASRNYSECHPDVYEEADAVSSAFCDELNELFQCSGNEKFDLIPIRSFVGMMVESGLARVSRESNDQSEEEIK